MKPVSSPMTIPTKRSTQKAFHLSARTERRLKTILTVTLTFLGAAFVLMPIYWMVNAAFRPINDILTFPPRIIPSTITFKHVVTILTTARYQQHLLNSAIITVTALFCTLILSTLAGYGFSRYKMPGGKYFLMAMMAMLMIPRVTLIIPYFKLANLVDLYDTRTVLIMTNVAFTIPMSTWLLKGYIDTIPHDLEEAAMIDGCSRLQAIWQVLIPLIFPGIVGVGSLVFINCWNDFLISFTLTQTLNAQPITIALAKFFGEFNRNWNGIMSLSMISSLPLMLLYMFFQKWVVQGLTSGSVK